MRDGRRYAFILQTITVFLIGITPIHIVNAQDNESCFECHNEALLEMSAEDRLEMLEPSPPVESGIRPEEYLKYNKPFALLSLAIDQEKYEASVHSELECITCHEDIEDIPHKQHLQTPTACCNCHDEEIAEAVEKSVHGKASEDKCAAGCIGCHDPHYGKSKDFWSSTFEIIGCLPCHESCTTEPIAKHDKWLSQARLHLTKIECDISKVGCVACHVPFGKKKDPHRIVSAKLAIRDCSKCHSSNSFLFSKKSEPPNGFIKKITNPDFTRSELMKEGQYLIGANRIPLLDTICLIVIFGTFGLPLVHGGLRFLTRKRR